MSQCVSQSAWYACELCLIDNITNMAYLRNTMLIFLLLLLSNPELFALTNWALHKPTLHSSTQGAPAKGAVDGKAGGRFHGDGCTQTTNQVNFWWIVDLGQRITVTDVSVQPRGLLLWVLVVWFWSQSLIELSICMNITLVYTYLNCLDESVLTTAKQKRKRWLYAALLYVLCTSYKIKNHSLFDSWFMMNVDQTKIQLRTWLYCVCV